MDTGDKRTRDEKRMFSAEVEGIIPSRLRPQPMGEEEAELGKNQPGDQNEIAFSRELVVRLIDWVKHI